MPDTRSRKHRLENLVILLLAGFPDFIESETELSEKEIHAHEEEAIRFDEAIISLARAVFSEGGRLAFPDHPLLTPLITQIASEYWEPASIETTDGEKKPLRPQGAPVLIFNPRPHTLLEKEFTAITPGYVEIIFEIPTDPIAILYIGGSTEQSKDEFSGWVHREGGARVFVISSTGGATRKIVENNKFVDLDERVWRGIQDNLGSIHFQAPGPEKPKNHENDMKLSDEETVPEFRYAVYPVVMARVLDEIVRSIS
jgi:hypothetical protein